MHRPPPEPPILLRIPEVADLLACSRAKIYALAAAGQLPGQVRIGSSWRVSRAVLLRWIEQQAGPEPRP